MDATALLFTSGPVALTWLEAAGMGVLTGFVAIAAWEAGRWCFCNRRLHVFKALAGDYDVRWKLSGELDSGTAQVRVEGNVLDVTFTGLPDDESIRGHIEMDTRLRRTGRGYYWQTKNGERLWGFWNVQWDDDGALLVHTTFAHGKEHEPAVVQGKIWQPRPATA
jgi:hypothetical protein